MGDKICRSPSKKVKRQPTLRLDYLIFSAFSVLWRTVKIFKLRSDRCHTLPSSLPTPTPLPNPSVTALHPFSPAPHPIYPAPSTTAPPCSHTPPPVHPLLGLLFTRLSWRSSRDIYIVNYRMVIQSNLVYSKSTEQEVLVRIIGR